MRVIANPPLGVFTVPDINVGHASFLILQDVIARHKARTEPVVFPAYSFNVFGKRTDAYIAANGSSSVNGLMSRPKIAKLNLMSDDCLADNEPAIADGIQDDISKLYRDRYLFEEDGRLFFDVTRLSRLDLAWAIEGISCRPARVAGELRRMVATLNEPIPVTRPTDYSVINPLGGENIGPLFTLANLWNHKYPGADYSFFCSNNTLAKYAFFRIMTQTALGNDAGMDELLVWPRVAPEGGMDQWPLEKLCATPYDSDMLRVAVLAAYSENSQSVALQQSHLVYGRKFVYLVGNLRKALGKPALPPAEPDRDLDEYRFDSYISRMQNAFKEISAEIRVRRDDGTLEDAKGALLQRYATLVRAAEPAIPAMCRHVED